MKIVKWESMKEISARPSMIKKWHMKKGGEQHGMLEIVVLDDFFNFDVEDPWKVQKDAIY